MKLGRYSDLLPHLFVGVSLGMWVGGLWGSLTPLRPIACGMGLTDSLWSTLTTVFCCILSPRFI